MLTKRNGFIKFMKRLDGEDVPDHEFYYTGEDYSVQLRRVRETILELKERGRSEALMYSFTWSHTPQGSRHWDRIYNGWSTPTEEDYEYLNWLIETYS